MFKIEKNVPIPKKQTGQRAIYPFRDMVVGDSFFVPCDSPRMKTRLQSCVTRYNSSMNAKFICRKYEKGYRVWRIK